MYAKQSRTRSEPVNYREASPKTSKCEVFEKGPKKKHAHVTLQINKGKIKAPA